MDEMGGRRRRAMVHGRGHPGRGRGRMRRGDIRTAVLAVLSEGPGHGYDVIQRLEDKTEGSWRPSPGSAATSLLSCPRGAGSRRNRGPAHRSTPPAPPSGCRPGASGLVPSRGGHVRAPCPAAASGQPFPPWARLPYLSSSVSPSVAPSVRLGSAPGSFRSITIYRDNAFCKIAAGGVAPTFRPWTLPACRSSGFPGCRS